MDAQKEYGRPDRIRVGINGYGVIGRRVADAVVLQGDLP